MKKLLLIILITFSSIIVFAQTVTETTENWQALAPIDQDYSIECPTTQDGFGHTVLNGTYYFIGDGDSALDYVKTLKKPKNTVTVGKYKANKFVFEDADGYYQTILIVRTLNNYYAFHTLSLTKENPDVEHFFNSLKIIEKPKVKKPTSQNKKVDKPVQNPTQKQDSSNLSNERSSGYGNGRNSGTGNGIGNGTGDGVGDSNSEQTTEKPIQRPKITGSVTITSKLKPSYTDLARQRLIQGTVTLRVTFLANGTIGAVTPISKLPFGLTVSAIAAAKNIQFEPAMKDDVAYSVTKVVQYGFTIY